MTENHLHQGEGKEYLKGTGKCTGSQGAQAWSDEEKKEAQWVGSIESWAWRVNVIRRRQKGSKIPRHRWHCKPERVLFSGWWEDFRF